MSQSSDPNFTRVISSLQSQAASADQALRNLGQALFETLGYTGDPTDYQAIADWFSRDASARLYHTTVTNRGSINQLASAKLSSDFLAGVHRDYLLHRMSRVRAIAHEASRRHQHAAPNGPVLTNLGRQPQSLLTRVSPTPAFLP